MPNLQFLDGTHDPENNLAFDLHLYLGYDFSGTHNACAWPGFGPQNLNLVTDVLREHTYKALFSELGGGSNEICCEAVNNTIKWFEDHDESIGWSYWAAGPLSGYDFLSVEPDQGPEF